MLPEPGQKIDLGSWVVDKESVGAFLMAVGDSSPIYNELDVVPPMALAARALGVLLNKLALPAGTVHVAQELDWRRMVRYGEEVFCVASLSRPRRRGGWQFVTAEFSLRGADASAFVTGKSTVLVPMIQSAS